MMVCRTQRGLSMYAAATLWLCVLTATAASDCPAPDLSGDCRVDLADLAMLVDQWLDGAAMPTAGLRAHWSMDEGAGEWAHDASPSGVDAHLRNGATWAPDGGTRGGAVALDGLDDYLQADFVLDPSAGPFSAFAWVRGGHGKEVVLAQTDGGGTGREWLHTDPTYGKLITRLSDGGSALMSQAIITDGAWHHAGVVWDGQRRSLYVDGIQVVRDPSPLGRSLEPCDGAMYIGADQSLAGYMFWEGAIDDVRIYGRALGEQEIRVLAGQDQAPSANLNGVDGINMEDLAVLAQFWLTGPPGEYRCIWVDSWGRSFRTPAEAEELIRTCRENNINTVIVEIRKIGDAYYQSTLEPRATNIPDPSFDPLGYLIDLAHDTSGGKGRIQVHGWFVAQRIAKTEQLAPQHILSLHPEYQMQDLNGEFVVDNSRYIDPGHPGAVDHNVAVIADCLSRYDLDGINLDYIRYPGPAWGYNPVSVDRFNAFHGRQGRPDTADPAWAAWRRECMTLQVKKIYLKSLMIDPMVVVTADTINWGSAYDDYENSSPWKTVFQDWVGWLRAGIIDYNALMNYVRNADAERFYGWSDLSLDNDDGRGSIIGIGAYMQTSVEDSIEQLLWARQQKAEGLNIYDWYTEVAGNTAGQTRTDFYEQLRTQVFPQWVDPPVPEWKSHPAGGIVEGTILFGGSPVDHAVVEIAGLANSQTYTDGSGWYGILDVPPGEHTLWVTLDGMPAGSTVLRIPRAGEIVTIHLDVGD